MLVLEHYRDLDPGPFGPPLASRRRFESLPSATLRDQLRAAAASGDTTIELRGPALNPLAGHATTLAAAFADAGPELRVRRAEWLPPRPPAPAVLPLLRRIDALEIEYPSVAPAARRLYRQRFSHRQYQALIEWLRRHRVEPVLVVRPGLPGETEATVIETLRRIYSLRPGRVRVEPFTAEPESFFAVNRERFHLAIEEEPPYRVLAHRAARSFELRWLVAICEKSVKDYGYWTAAAAAARESGGTA